MGIDGGTVWVGGGFVVDATHWPLLLERMPVVFPNDDDTLDAWIAHVEAVMAKHASPFVMVVDALPTKVTANAHARKRMADWLSESDAYRRHCLGTIFIVGSPMIRGAVTAINWLTRPNPPRTMVGSMSDALAESRVLLARAGLGMPEGVDAALKTA